jgi:aminoglycoside phosphotransferase (APT) family kinase protein
MSAFGCADEPLLNRALTALLASTLSGGRLALCHGDPNPFNYLFRGQQLVGAVDWEQALISDPRSDIGQLVSLSLLRGAAPYGPPSENLFVQLYEATTGERLESMELFRARWLFQLGVVYHGWKPTERNHGSPGRRSRTSLPALSRSYDVAARQDAESEGLGGRSAGREPFVDRPR